MQSSVRVFLAAALSPNVQAASRWLGVSATSRRAFALGGKDTGSLLLHWLAAGRPCRSELDEDCAAAAHQVGVALHVPGDSFLAWYQALNRGYPFLDYSQSDALDADARLMASYAAQSDAPPPTSSWSGLRRRLTSGRLSPYDSSQSPAAVHQPPSEDLIAGWLRCAVGITRLRATPNTQVAHRTSPSGGARHPTDIAVSLGAAWPTDLVGSWWYDGLEHCLVAADWTLPALPVGADQALFAVTSHVARAMWRYRDVRAFRPVLIDAGHVVETLMTVISATGWTSRWEPSPSFITVSGQLDPVLGYVVASIGDSGEAGVRATPQPAAIDGAGKCLRTNPVMSLRIDDCEVRAENHLRYGASLAVTPQMVDALAYATPSSRGDRPTSPEAIATAVGLDATALDRLVASGLLLPEQEGDRLWRAARHWFRHDWFLSLVAHAEEGSATRGGRHRQTMRPPQGAPRLAAALSLRRTCRAFSGQPIEDAVMGRALDALAHPVAGVTVVIMLRHPAIGLRAGTYFLDVDGASWSWVDTPMPSEDAVSAAAIGQPWARGFALLAWLIPTPEDGPGAWEDAFIACGRVAQRVALSVCNDPTVGVFQSPALIDEILERILNDRTSPDGAYLVGVGLARDQPSTQAPLFSPIDILGPSQSS